jgi:hypothetical protein
VTNNRESKLPGTFEAKITIPGDEWTDVFHWNEEYIDWMRVIENKSCRLCRKGTNLCFRRGIPGHLNPFDMHLKFAQQDTAKTVDETGVGDADMDDGVEDEEEEADGVEDEDEAEVVEATFVETDNNDDASIAANTLANIVSDGAPRDGFPLPDKDPDEDEEQDSLRQIQEACRKILS